MYEFHEFFKQQDQVLDVSIVSVCLIFVVVTVNEEVLVCK